ncbi:hypothetical protein CVT24_010236 [Panaeolus cyanescens]|uniref:Nucleoplasmin-like domain-containing protein n=1 Tax=Panaeolus cyanescens TaxID=181874 RepID=A0A409WMK0_9AGAR|nr:hypothetical protein CVT24_010236 [Panaeolus cyanescens]
MTIIFYRLQRIKSGEAFSLDNQPFDLHLCNACLSNPVRKDDSRTSLTLRFSETSKPDGVLATFFKNRTENAKLDCMLKAGGKYELTIQGDNDVDLFGYYDEPEVKKPEPRPVASTARTSRAKRALNTEASTSTATLETPAPAAVPATRGPGRPPKRKVEDTADKKGTVDEGETRRKFIKLGE